MNYDVICVGDATLDITMTDIPNDALSHDFALAASSRWSVGGDAANQACVLDALGMKTALIAKTGTDLIGDTIHQILSECGIDLSHFIRSSRKESGFCVVAVQPDGQRSFLLSLGSGDRDLGLEEINLDLLGHTRAVSVGSLFCLRKMDLGGTQELFKKARQKGVITFADMTGDSSQLGPKAVDGIYPYTDYLLPSLEEGIYVTGETNPRKIADVLLKKGTSTVIIKLGAQGCYVKNAKEDFYSPAFVTDVIDTTGCGDNFTAAFISGVLNGKTLRDCARMGNGAGAINASALGAHGALHSRKQLEDFMKHSQLSK